MPPANKSSLLTVALEKVKEEPSTTDNAVPSKQRDTLIPVNTLTTNKRTAKATESQEHPNKIFPYFLRIDKCDVKKSLVKLITKQTCPTCQNKVNHCMV